MKIALLVTLWTLIGPTSSNKSGDYSISIEKIVNSVSSILINIADAGGKTWEKLGHGQAVSILQDIGTDAANLEIQNNNLKKELDKARKEHKPQAVPIEQRVGNLTSALRDLSGKLSKFAFEVDQAAHPIGEEARVQFNNVASAKGIILSDIQSNWENGQYQSAIDEIDEANTQLETMRQIVTCLQDSITNKKSACDPKKFTQSNGKVTPKS